MTKQLSVVSNMAFYVQSTITVISGRQLFLKGYIFVKRLHLTVNPKRRTTPKTIVSTNNITHFIKNEEHYEILLIIFINKFTETLHSMSSSSLPSQRTGRDGLKGR